MSTPQWHTTEAAGAVAVSEVVAEDAEAAVAEANTPPCVSASMRSVLWSKSLSLTPAVIVALTTHGCDQVAGSVLAEVEAAADPRAVATGAGGAEVASPRVAAAA